MQPRPDTESKLSRKLINYKERVCHVIENIGVSSLIKLKNIWNEEKSPRKVTKVHTLT